MALPSPLTVATNPAAVEEQAYIEEVAALLEQATSPPLLSFASGESVPLGHALQQLLKEATAILARGEEVALVPVHTVLTTQQAADLLGVSRQYLTRLLDGGAIPFHRVGSHRRVIYAELLAYQRQQQRQRRTALQELARVSEELGLYDRPE